MPDGVAIREANSADARSIAEVHVASWSWAYHDLMPAAFLEGLSVRDRERQWVDTLRDDAERVIVALHGDELIGFASAGPSRDDDAPAGTAEVFTVYLLEGFQGRGVGEMLLEDIVSGLRDAGYARTTLWVLESNELARRFYERHGWTWDGTTSAHQIQCANLPIVRYEADLTDAPTNAVVPRSR